MSDLEDHIHNLDRLCRLCGARVQTREEHAKGHTPKLCSAYPEKILKTFGVLLSSDETDCHPKHICHTCFCKLFHDKQWAPVTWKQHPRTGLCEVCAKWEVQAKGGRPKKRKFHHPGPAIQKGFSLSSLESGPKLPHIDTTKYTTQVPSELKCGLCQQLVNEAVESPCGHLFCSGCIKEALVLSEKCLCTTCRTEFKIQLVTSPKQYLQQLLSFTPLKCTTCKENLQLKDMDSHLCQYNKPDDILRHPQEQPLTPMMEAIGAHILKAKLKQSADGMTASFKTRGQV